MSEYGTKGPLMPLCLPNYQEMPEGFGLMAFQKSTVLNDRVLLLELMKKAVIQPYVICGALAAANLMKYVNRRYSSGKEIIK